MNSLKAEIWQNIYFYKRYLYSYISNFFLVIMMFQAIFWGGSLVGNGVLGSSLNGLVIGYSLWTLIQNTIENMGSITMGQAQNGILEQQYLMPISSRRLFFNKTIVNLLISIIEFALVLFFIMFLTHRWLHLPLILLIPFVLSLGTIMGLGYLVVSLVLQVKRIGSTLIIFQYVYLGILLTDFENYSFIIKCLSALLPISPMVDWMRLAVNSRPYSLAFYLVASLVNAILWLVLGLLVFDWTDKYVKQHGTLALY